MREVTGTDDTVYHIPNGSLESFSLNGDVYQIHSDALSSVRMITDSAGDVVARFEFGAYGEEIFVSAIPALQNFPYRFVGGAGCRIDAETGLVYKRARHYDPSLQRFISRDPIGLRGGSNTYRYCGNSPINFTDAMGMVAPPGPTEVFPVGGLKPIIPGGQGAQGLYFDFNGVCECPIGTSSVELITDTFILDPDIPDSIGTGPSPQPKPLPRSNELEMPATGHVWSPLDLPIPIPFRPEGPPRIQRLGYVRGTCLCLDSCGNTIGRSEFLHLVPPEYGGWQLKP